MNKSGLISEVAKRTGQTTAETLATVDAVLDVIVDELKVGNKVTIVNFGTFGVKEYSERVGRNPRNQEQIIIPSKTRPTFKAADKLKGVKKASAAYGTAEAISRSCSSARKIGAEETSSSRCLRAVLRKKTDFTLS